MSDAAAAPVAPAAAPAIPNGSTRPAPAAAPSPAAQTPASKPETPAPAKTYRLKVNGAEREVSEQTYHAYAQKAAAADQLLAEAKAERAKLDQERASLKQRFGANWREVLEENGHDPEEFLRRAILERYGQSEATPEQRRAQEAQQRAEAAEAKLRDFESQQQTAQEQQEEMRARGEYQERFLAALEKTGFPADPSNPLAIWAVGHMAALEEANLDAGTQLPPEVLAEMVQSDLEAQHLAVLGALDGDALLDRLGADMTKKISKALVARYERSRNGAAAAPVAAQAPAAPTRPGLAVPVTLPPREPNGQFVSREQRRGAAPLFAGFVPASITRG